MTPKVLARFRSFAVLVLLFPVLAACTVPDEPVEVFDPFEEQNRAVHEFNRSVDRAVLRPVATAYGAVIPRPVRRGASNFVDNLDEPSHIINDLLQGSVEDAVHNIFRFLVNSTVGIAGLFDVASGIGIEERPSDFGETLHVWGAEEGAYLEVPLLGASTQRDAAGIVVDIFLNPLAHIGIGDEEIVLGSMRSLQIVEARERFGPSIDAVLYESADSYAAARILYLQNRRFELGDTEDLFFDPFEDEYNEQ